MSIATVVSISGQAWARDAEGDLRELQQGDQLLDGETLVTSDSGAVQLDFEDGLPPVAIGGGQQVAMSGELDADEPVEPDEASAQDEGIDALLAALDGEGDLLDDLEATAAGGGDGAEGGGHSFIQLARIVESVDPLAFAFDTARANNIDSELRGAPAFLDSPSANVAPEASNDAFTTNEDTALSGANVLANDTDPEGDSLSVSDAGSRQVTFTGPDGFTVTAEVTIDEGGNVSFDPSGAFDALGVGEAATGTLTYTVSDGSATDTASVTLTVNGVNDAPTAGNDGTGAADDVFTTDEDTALSGANVLANDTDPENDALTVSDAG
ncbi:VCBS repeat-containing protein, partial [Onishia taeanensis]